MTTGMKTVIYPVNDIAAAKRLYGSLLGVPPSMDEVYYVGFEVDGQDIGLDPNGHSKGMTGPVGYWHVDDINESLEALLEAGAETQQPISDVGGGKLIASVKDADGNGSGSSKHPTGVDGRFNDADATQWREAPRRPGRDLFSGRRGRTRPAGAGRTRRIRCSCRAPGSPSSSRACRA